MKKIIIINVLGFVFLATFFASCVKERGKEVALETTDLTGTSAVQVYNALVGSLRNYVYVDAKVVTGSILTYGTAFPSTPASYSITSGFREFLVRDTLSATTQLPVSFAENFNAGGNYTIFMYDTITAAKQKTVVNNIVIPSDTTARLRFANFIYNPTALASGFDIFSVKRNAVIFTNVKETEVTDFIPYASALTDTFYIRLNGSSTNLQNVDTTGKPTILTLQAVLTPTRLRSYTLIWRGGFRAGTNRTTTGTAIPSARILTSFANY